MIMSSSLDDSQTSPGLPKNTMTTTTTTSLRPPEQGLKCPRCDSPNTKFCYFNNYSLTQPRHFCKTCRRYWTKGGALRNVPVGGGCRKNKKSKSSASSSSSSPSSSCVYLDPFDPVTFNGLPPTPMDFQLGILPFPRLHSPASAGAFNTTQFVSFGEVGVNNEMGGSSAGLNFTTHGNLASSIESLSSINQELHWKLQQQRLALFFGGARKESSVPALPGPLVDDEQQEPVSFDQHGTDGSRAELCGTQGPTTTAWFLESSCTVPYANENNDNTNDTSNWSGVPAWNDIHQFTALP